MGILLEIEYKRVRSGSYWIYFLANLKNGFLSVFFLFKIFHSSLNSGNCNLEISFFVIWLCGYWGVSIGVFVLDFHYLLSS